MHFKPVAQENKRSFLCIFKSEFRYKFSSFKYINSQHLLNVHEVNSTILSSSYESTNFTLTITLWERYKYDFCVTDKEHEDRKLSTFPGSDSTRFKSSLASSRICAFNHCTYIISIHYYMASVYFAISLNDC